MLLVYDSGPLERPGQPIERRSPHALTARREPRLLRADLALAPVYHLRTVSHSLVESAYRRPLPLVHLTRKLRIYASVDGRVFWGSPTTLHEQEILLPPCLNRSPLDLTGEDTVVAADQTRCALSMNAVGEMVPAYDLSFTLGDGSGFVEACSGTDGLFALTITGKEDIDHDASGTFTYTEDAFSLSMQLRLYAATGPGEMRECRST